MTRLPCLSVETRSLLESATGPDRDIDRRIYLWAHGREFIGSNFVQYEPGPVLPSHTANLTDALALLAEKAPEAVWIVWNNPSGGFGCTMTGASYTGLYPSPALAVLTALFRALSEAGPSA